MKLINSNVELLDFSNSSIFQQIEIAGRTCYKSEDKITPDSAKNFVQMLIDRKHYAMLEHGTVYLKDLFNKKRYERNPYSAVVQGNNIYITTNYRVLIENNWLDDLQHVCKPTNNHEKRISVRFICDRGVSHELVRHRVFSFAQESTRYCNYTRNKFNHEITCVIPSWLKKLKSAHYKRTMNVIKMNGIEFDHHNSNKDEWNFVSSLLDAEFYYFEFIENSDNNYQSQQARQVLPNALKTEVIMTGFVSDWKDFFELRCAKTAHPDMQYLANKLRNQFKKLNYI